MYHYVEDKELIKRMRNRSGRILQNLCHILKEDYDIGATFYLIGSGAKNLITQNEKEPIDLDYNLELVRYDDLDERHIKECVRKAFNKALKMEKLPNCEDSTSSLTTKLIDKKYSIDICIITIDSVGNIHRLIHKKTGYMNDDRYYWNQALNSNNVKVKADFIKQNNQWLLVREEYLKLKNHYLRSNDHNHPSCICYIEAVNHVYDSLTSNSRSKTITMSLNDWIYYNN